MKTSVANKYHLTPPVNQGIENEPKQIAYLVVIKTLLSASQAYHNVKLLRDHILSHVLKADYTGGWLFM